MSDDKISSLYYRYWGKAGKGEDENSYHLLPYHCLDVAAVGMTLIRRHDHLQKFLATAAGTSEETLVRWVTFFLLIHDLGKFSSVFQRIRPDLTSEEITQPTRTQPYIVRHDTLGFLLWKEGFVAKVRNWEVLIGAPSDDTYWPDYFEYWARAVLCHHGMPPKEGERQTPAIRRYFSSADRLAVTDFIDALPDLLPAAPDSPNMAAGMEQLCDNDYPAVLSWWLAGFAILCDWLGSNQDFFPYHSETMPLTHYWDEHALPNAERIVDKTNILPIQSAPRQAPTKLFKFLKQPTPLQQAVLETPLAEGPQLFILEDVTGAGKTEAAYLLLNRMMAGGLAQGFYLALPTMATANGLYRRSTDVYKKLFDAKNRPSLVLAHGAARLDEHFTDSIAPITPGGDANYSGEEPSATAYCNGWFTDNRKKSLLAHAGIGTLDQALLAVLQSRHQSLRLLGLMGKVLVVDEVHAADAYMHRLLQILLELHATAGGSAILLSATLPLRMRRELASAFLRGLNSNAPELRSRDYPLLTRIGGSTPTETPVATRESVQRDLAFTPMESEAVVEKWIVDRAREGGCVCWVRNSVADAIEAHDRLAERLPEGQVKLFHARFALVDRMRIENRVTADVGPKSTEAQRAGRVLVATQVVEQSLDLDFDHMVSDLAPIDLLLQRAGRLRRHTRDPAGNPTKEKDLRGPACLHVLCPEPADDADKEWLNGILPRTAMVYEDLGRLWLTAHLIHTPHALHIPGELRQWIEAVYGEETEQLPVGIRGISLSAEGSRAAGSSQARANAIFPQEGYRMQDFEWWDETRTPTRLGEATVTLRLARWDGERLTPWAEHDRHAWAFSEVSVRASMIREPVMPDKACAAEVKRLKERWRGNWDSFLVMPLVENEKWAGAGRKERGDSVLVEYSENRGLEIQKN